MSKIKITSQRQQDIVKAIEDKGEDSIGELMSRRWKAAHTLVKNNPEKFIIKADPSNFYPVITFKKEA